MTPSTRRDAALALLARTGIRSNNYAPPALKLLWAMGLDVPPPHFASFAASTVLTGSFFGLVWGLLMWFWQWSDTGMSAGLAAALSVVAGLLFGLSMASYYAYGRRKHRLPPWTSLG